MPPWQTCSWYAIQNYRIRRTEEALGDGRPVFTPASWRLLIDHSMGLHGSNKLAEKQKSFAAYFECYHRWPCIPEAEELGAPKPRDGVEAGGGVAAAALLAAGAPKPNPPAAADMEKLGDCRVAGYPHSMLEGRMPHQGPRREPRSDSLTIRRSSTTVLPGRSGQHWSAVRLAQRLQPGECR